jgi:hypothetical protein
MKLPSEGMKLALMEANRENISIRQNSPQRASAGKGGVKWVERR